MPTSLLHNPRHQARLHLHHLLPLARLQVAQQPRRRASASPNRARGRGAHRLRRLGRVGPRTPATGSRGKAGKTRAFALMALQLRCRGLVCLLLLLLPLLRLKEDMGSQHFIWGLRRLVLVGRTGVGVQVEGGLVGWLCLVRRVDCEAEFEAGRASGWCAGV